MKPGPKRKILVDPETGCHVVQRGVNHAGYAVYKHKGRRHSAARVVWMETYGPIADGMQIDHLCRNTRCVNLDHLELVTCTENIRRSPRCKLSIEQVREIRASTDRGMDLAERYGVSQALISMVRSGKIWADDGLKWQRETGG